MVNRSDCRLLALLVRQKGLGIELSVFDDQQQDDSTLSPTNIHFEPKSETFPNMKGHLRMAIPSLGGNYPVCYNEYLSTDIEPITYSMDILPAIGHLRLTSQQTSQHEPCLTK
jgi:hypothetical protein